MAIEDTSAHKAVLNQMRNDSSVQIANLVVHRISHRWLPPRRAKRGRLSGPCPDSSFVEIYTSSFEGLVNLRLAPLECRRTIAMLGLLYSIADKLARPCVCQLFEQELRSRSAIPTRGAALHHNEQFK